MKIENCEQNAKKQQFLGIFLVKFPLQIKRNHKRIFSLSAGKIDEIKNLYFQKGELEETIIRKVVENKSEKKAI